MRRLLALAVTVSIGAGIGAELAFGQTAVARKVQDGIAAELTVTPDRASIRWKFLEGLPTPLEEVTASLNGRNVGVPVIQPYPADGQLTNVLALLDISGLQRQEQIDWFKTAMLTLVARKGARDQIGFAVYALEGGLLTSASNDPIDVVNMLRVMPAVDQKGNLSGALISSIRTLEMVDGDRRAIYCFTDGHDDGSVSLDQVAELALSTGVALNFVVLQSDRPADLPALARAAARTGGQLVATEAFEVFFTQPFALLDSGAEVTFPLDGARHYFWEGGAQLEVRFRYGDRKLEISAPAPVPAATAGETASFVVNEHPVGTASAAAVLLAGLAGGVLVRRRRPVRAAQPETIDEQAPAEAGSGPLPALATLEDTETGEVFSIVTPLTRIGRSPDNDIVLDEATVGRFHAVLQQIGDHAFSVQDQSSANGTLVNERRIDTATLADGDLIEFGRRSLRFREGGQT
jgi:hypothetical protein